MSRKSKLKLKYIGGGSYVPGIPARDLSESEVKEYGLDGLLATRLYEEIQSAPVKQPAKQEDEYVRNQET